MLTFHQRFIFLFIIITVFITNDLLAQRQQSTASQLRLAQHFERAGQPERAATTYLALFKTDPRNNRYYAGLKRNYIQLRKYEELLPYIKQRLTLFHDFNLTHLDLAEVWFYKGEIEKALDSWRSFLTQFPSKATYQAVANKMVSNKHDQAALDVYLQGRKTFDNQNLFEIDIAHIYALQKNYVNATVEYLHYLKHNSGNISFVQRKLLDLTKDPKSRQSIILHLERANTSEPNLPYINQLLAAIFVQSGNYKRAFNIYKALQVATKTKDKTSINSEIFSFAEKAQAKDSLTYAEQAYLLILKDKTRQQLYLPSLKGLAETYREQGHNQKALTIFNKLFKASGSKIQSSWGLQALFQQGDIYLFDLKQIDKAIKVFHSIYYANKKVEEKQRIEAAYRVADCHIIQNDITKATKWFKLARDISPNKLIANQKTNYLLARLEYFQGHFSKAQELLEKIVSDGNRSKQEGSMVNDALELLLLIDANAADSAGAFLSFAQAEHKIAQQQQQNAIDKLLSLTQKYNQSNIVPHALFRLGNLYASTGRHSEAAKTFEAIVKKHSDHVMSAQALFQAASIYARHLNDTKQAQKLFEELLEAYPISPFVEEARRQARTLEKRSKVL